MKPPRLWYLFRYLPLDLRYKLAEALVWGGGAVMHSCVEAAPDVPGGIRGYRLDAHDGSHWYHETCLGARALRANDPVMATYNQPMLPRYH